MRGTLLGVHISSRDVSSAPARRPASQILRRPLPRSERPSLLRIHRRRRARDDCEGQGRAAGAAVAGQGGAQRPNQGDFAGRLQGKLSCRPCHPPRVWADRLSARTTLYVDSYSLQLRAELCVACALVRQHGAGLVSICPMWQRHCELASSALCLSSRACQEYPWHPSNIPCKTHRARGFQHLACDVRTVSVRAADTCPERRRVNIW